ncbi:3,4-dioxygenase subunit beta [Actinoplanes campanulatus]|nr:3,4-dioxygenase subunit beta [Actinoplanes campanulatus]GID37440.1 3,4-dioxygenase subunit beta [Actinoplanes campanulatus]
MASYQGRPLPRPGVDILHQGLAFDLATMRRRQALRVFGLGAVALGLGGCGDEETATVETDTVIGEIPDETAGPYPGDGSNGPDVLTRSGVVRSDIRSSFGSSTTRAEGIPMTLTLAVQDLADGGAPFAGVAVYVWHCDRAGAYSLYSEGLTGENYLRGVQIADDRGEVTFTSIFPACYSGRWPHVHFEVYPDRASISDASNVIATSQVALPENICEEAYTQTGYEASVTNLAQVSLDDDNVFGDDSGALQLATVTGDAMSGYTVILEAGVDTTTTPTGGRLTGDGAPSGAPPSGGPGGPPPSR